MNFLAPWFLAGALLVVGPIIAHLIRRATRQRIPFSAVRFLAESRPRLDRRSRVQHPWLLLLRCLILALLAAAFARPYWPTHDATPAAVAPVRQRVIVLDHSASMRRPSLWEQARAQVLAAAEELTAADQLVLLTAGQRIEERVSLDTWLNTAATDRSGLIRAVLDQLEPGWGAFALDAAAEAAREQWERMAEHTPGARTTELMVVSDFAAGSRLSGLAGLAWPPGAVVHLRPVTPDAYGNASAHWLGWSQDHEGKRLARVRVSRDLESTGPLRWQLYSTENDTPLGPAEPLEVLPGSAQTLLFPWPADQRAVRFRLHGDQADFDNDVWIAAPIEQTLAVSYLGRAQDSDPTRAPFFIRRALQSWPDKDLQFRQSLDVSPAPTLIIVDQPLDPATAHDVRTQLAAGASALVLLGAEDADAHEQSVPLEARASFVETVALLTSESGWQPARPRTPALLGSVDFQHPLFVPFADPRFSDFTRIRFWQPRSMVPPAGSAAAMVARFDDELPAVVEVPVGQGRLILWGGGWTPAASQWVLSSKFVPWLQALVERASGGPPQSPVQELGAPGVDQAFAASALQPGLYARPEQPDARVAFNVPADESRLQPLALDVWEQLGVPLAASATAPRVDASTSVAARTHAASLEREQQIWRTLSWAALLLLAVESFVSGYLTRHGASARPTGDRSASAPA